MAYLKSTKRPKVINSELLDGVDRVSRSIEGCIKLAESVLSLTKTQQNPETSNIRRDRIGDMLSGIDRVDSTLIECINMAEKTHRLHQQDSTGKSCGKPKKANPRLKRIGPPLSGNPQVPSPKLLHKWTPEPSDFSDPLFDDLLSHGKS